MARSSVSFTVTMDRYTQEFLEGVFLLLVTIEDGDRALLPDAVVEAADELWAFLSDHGTRLFR